MNIYDPTKCKCRAREGYLLLAQFYYDTEQYDKAWRWYLKIENADLRGRSSFPISIFFSLDEFLYIYIALYQLATMCFEGVAPKEYTPVRYNFIYNH
jgi:hypothetical protein